MLNLRYSKKWEKSYDTSFSKFPKSKRETLKRELNNFLLSIAKGNPSRDDIEKYKLHKLKGDKQDTWEFHFKDDLCVMYKLLDTKSKEMLVLDIGTHSSLRLNGSMLNTASLENIRSLEFHYTF